MKRYEGMFVFDSGAAPSWSGVEEEIRRLLDRIGAQIDVCLKFDERKLAFEIERHKRGLYALTYFEADPGRIAELERDVRLSDQVLRALILRADELTAERLAELKAWPVETALLPATSETRRGDDDGRPRRGRDEGDDGDDDDRRESRRGSFRGGPRRGRDDEGDRNSDSDSDGD